MKKFLIFIILINVITPQEIWAKTNPYTISDLTPLHWTSENIGTIQYPPAIGPDGTIYQPTNNGLTKINSAGQIQWVLNDIFPPSGTPLIENDILYFATSGCNPFLYAYDTEKHQRWQYDLRQGQGVCGDNQSRSSVVFNHDKSALLVTISYPALAVWAFHLDGTIQWKKGLNGQDPNRSSVAVNTNGDLYLGTSGNGQLFALDSSGITRWIRSTPGNILTPLIGDDGNIYITTSGLTGGDTLLSFDPSGTLRWQHQITQSVITKPLIMNGTTLFLVERNILHAFHNNGQEVWKWTAPNSENLSTLTSDQNGVVYLGSQDTLYAISADGILKQQFTLQEDLNFPVIISQGVLLISSNKPFSSNTFLYALGTYIPPPAKTPVIFIPGIGGSELNLNTTVHWSQDNNHGGTFIHDYTAGEKIWVNELQAAKPGNDDYFDILRFDKQTLNSLEDISPSGYLSPFGYGDIDSFFQELGYAKGTNFFVFTYDWRKDIRHTEDPLDDLIKTAQQQTGSPKVNIVAHSMGGLVARNYSADPINAQKVDTLIELGVPHLGSVNALKILLYGDPLVKWILHFLPIGITAAETKDVVQNFPSSYQLLPSAKYYDFYTNNQSAPFPLENNNFLQTKSFLINVPINPLAFQKAEELHDFLDPLLGTPKSIHLYQIVGTSQPTVGQLQQGLWGVDEIFINGDGTVPLFSASLKNDSLDLSSQATTYYVDQLHSNLVSKSGVAMGIVKSILESSVLPVLAMEEKIKLEGIDIAVTEDATIDLYDQLGNHTGEFENKIPDTFYDPIGKIKHIFIKKKAASVKVKISSSIPKNITIIIRTYKDDLVTKTEISPNRSISDHHSLEFSVQPDLPALLDLLPEASSSSLISEGDLSSVGLTTTPHPSPSQTIPYPLVIIDPSQPVKISLLHSSLPEILGQNNFQPMSQTSLQKVRFLHIFIAAVTLIGTLLMILCMTFL